jgi:hypothetical protein
MLIKKSEMKVILNHDDRSDGKQRGGIATRWQHHVMLVDYRNMTNFKRDQVHAKSWVVALRWRI